MKRDVKPFNVAAGMLMLIVAGCTPASNSAPDERLILQIHPTFGPDEIRMSNGTVDLTIVPALGGRITRFGFVHDQNVLWTATHESLMHRDWGDWSNVGGDKSWVWPQDDWKQRTGSDWPPAAEFDTAAWAVTKMQDGEVEMTSPPLPHFDSARMVRRIALPPRGSRVILETSLLDDTGRYGRPMAPWNITQVPLPADLFAQQQPVRPNGDGSSRLIELTANALAAVSNGTRFTQRLLSPPGSAHSRLYIDPRPNRPGDAYAELEWAGRPVTGNSHITVEWELKRQPMPK